MAALIAAAEVWSLIGAINNDQLSHKEAGKLANNAQLLMPKNKAISASRLKYWTLAGDELETGLAETRAKELDLSLEGREVLDPASATVIVVIVAANAVVTWHLIDIAYKAIKDGQGEALVKFTDSVANVFHSFNVRVEMPGFRFGMGSGAIK